LFPDPRFPRAFARRDREHGWQHGAEQAVRRGEDDPAGVDQARNIIVGHFVGTRMSSARSAL